MEIRRDFYLNQLIRSMHNGMVKVITGIRRCGKSYLLDPLFKDYLLSTGVSETKIIKIDLSDAKNSDLVNPLELDKYIRGKINKTDAFYLFIDEIQLCKSLDNPAFDGFKTSDGSIPQITFYQVLNGLLSDYKNVDVYVTGSNSQLLSHDILTDFRGRGWQIRLAPLSFTEYASAKPTMDKRTAFEEYLTYGGMPGMVCYGMVQDKTRYLANLLEETYFKDIIERNNLKQNSLIKELAEVLASSEGSLISINKIIELFKQREDKSIGRETIDKYIDAFKNAFLIEDVERYNIRGGKIIAASKKYYFSDCGLRNSLLSFKQYDRGHLMESVIYADLKRRGYVVNVGIIPVNEIGENGREETKQYEVDFIATSGNEKLYIQSAYRIYDEKKMAQETKSLLKIRDSFKKIIVDGDLYMPYVDERGIKHIGIIDFLLNETNDW